MATPVLLLEARPKIDPQNRAIRLGSQLYTHPTAPGPFFDAILERSRIRREIFEDGTPFGAASNDYGLVRAKNIDGWLDWLENAAVDAYGGTITMSVLPDVSAPYSARKTVFTGRLGQPQIGDVAEFRVLDDFAMALDKNLGIQRFKGDNVLPLGVEGVEDLKDQWLPALYGRAFNCNPPCCNTSKLIYCIADRAVAAILVDAVDDKGATLTRGTARSTVADLIATSPAAGTWDYFLGDASTPAYIRLGSTPAGDVTVTMRSGGTAASRTAGQIWKRLITERAGIASTNISDTDIALLDSQNSAEVGFWVDTGGATIRDRVDFIAQTVGAGYWLDRTGVWRIARIGLPSGTPVVTFKSVSLSNPGRVGDADIIAIEPVFTSRDDGGRPADLVRLRYARNHHVQSKDSLAGVALASATRRAQEWLEATYPASTGASGTAEHEQAWDTGFADSAPTVAEAQRRYGVFGSRLRRHKVTSRLSPALADLLDLNVTVKVEYPRYGLDAGRLASVSALEIDLLTLDTDVTVWSVPS